MTANSSHQEVTVLMEELKKETGMEPQYNIRQYLEDAVNQGVITKEECADLLVSYFEPEANEWMVSDLKKEA